VPRHAEVKKVAYQPGQMFDLVADVAQYPKFLPWCVGARIRSRSEREIIADLTIGFGPFRETFTSRVTLDRPGEINVRYENGPFRYLRNIWRFLPDPGGCEIDFFVDFEFKNRVLQAAIGAVFHETTRVMVNAFLRRAREVYGPPQEIK
jgi:coenzyme Q-binding protein COQ10